jgi:hypothetical protein
MEYNAGQADKGLDRMCRWLPLAKQVAMKKAPAEAGAFRT